ncbi:MAG: LuxR C-terminal-related transcriptional regulator, partial [Paracoccaceae bacterium]
KMEYGILETTGVKLKNFSEKPILNHYINAGVYVFNKKALELEPEKIADVASALSPRELETLTLLALGYNRALVGQTLSISEHTVRVYVESARFKLGSMNTTHAVACALSRGLNVI